MQPLKDSLAPLIEQQEKFKESIAPILDQQQSMQNLASLETKAILPTVENPAAKALQEIKDCAASSKVSEMAERASFSDFSFQETISDIRRAMSNSIVPALVTFGNSSIIAQIKTITSSIGSWLQTVDFTPLVNMLQEIQSIGFEHDYEKVDEIFLKAMFDARWFPYAGWIANYGIVVELLDILKTSRASKNRTKRIDKLIFTYYNKEELANLKRAWRSKNLPPYMTRILIQSVQAYNRREYALTVSALSTLWEGIIQEKMNDDSYRVSKKTRENLKKLIENNEFDKILSSFCEEFIFYDCRKPEDVKPDVPGRHGIAHGWYDTYPNRKVALNAILFTDFLLTLKPIEKAEDVVV